MTLLATYLSKEIKELHANNVKVTAIGDISKLPKNCIEQLNNAFELTKDNTGVNLNLALNYGSRDDIKNAIKEAISKEDIDEKYIRDFINCTLIDKNSEYFNMDKIMFIYQYGSKLAKKIAVDEKLKII